MNTALKLLEEESKETIHYNLEYIARNSQKDVVAEALKPEGTSLSQTVDFLYSAQENYDTGKVKNIANFVNGFEGMREITEAEIACLGFNDVNESKKRMKKAMKSLGRYVGYAITAGIVCGASAFFTAHNITQNEYLPFAAGLAGYSASFGVAFLWGLHFDAVNGDTKPRDAFNSLDFKASQADQYVRLYKIMKDKGFVESAKD